MYIHSITFAVDKEVEEAFKEWVVKNVSPIVSEDILYNSARFSRVITDDPENISYNLQCSVIDIQSFYENPNTDWLCNDLQAIFGEKVICFQTILRIEEDFF